MFEDAPNSRSAGKSIVRHSRPHPLRATIRWQALRRQLQCFSGMHVATTANCIFPFFQVLCPPSWATIGGQERRENLTPSAPTLDQPRHHSLLFFWRNDWRFGNQSTFFVYRWASEHILSVTDFTSRLMSWDASKTRAKRYWSETMSSLGCGCIW